MLFKVIVLNEESVAFENAVIFFLVSKIEVGAKIRRGATFGGNTVQSSQNHI